VLIGAASIARGRDTATDVKIFGFHRTDRGSEQVAAGKEVCRSRGRPQETTGLSTAAPGTVNNATRVVPNAVHRPVGGAVDGSRPACHGARRHETPGEQRLSLCKGKAKREPALTRGLVRHEQGRYSPSLRVGG
jgi:hypothetical protein